MSLSSLGAASRDVGVLLAAAGRGERAGTGDLKQFRRIRGIPLLLRSLQPFTRLPRVREIVIALPAEAVTAPPDWLRAMTRDRVRLVAGGPSRIASVAAALAALSPQSRIVLVHDAARPFVAADTIDRVIAMAEGGAGAVAAVPVADTLKRAATDGTITDTVDRANLWRAHTPQAFPRAMLERAYAAAALADGATDDAQLVERAGFRVCVVWDHSTNLKLTTPDDFQLAEALAQ